MYVFAGSKVIAEYTPSAQTTAPTKEYVYLGSQLLATLDASGNPTYRHPDHLSARLYSNSSGTVIGTQGHLPVFTRKFLCNSLLPRLNGRPSRPLCCPDSTPPCD